METFQDDIQGLAAVTNVSSKKFKIQKMFQKTHYGRVRFPSALTPEPTYVKEDKTKFSFSFFCVSEYSTVFHIYSKKIADGDFQPPPPLLREYVLILQVFFTCS